MVMQNVNAKKSVNRIEIVLPDHIDWIKSQLLKKNNFMMSNGRDVLIAVANSDAKNIVNIPARDDKNYRKAWADVYNYSIEYLEGTLDAICREGKIVSRVSDSKIIIEGNFVQIPPFQVESANYARLLESIIDKYKELKAIAIEKAKREISEISAEKYTVSTDKVDVEEDYKNLKEIMRKEALEKGNVILTDAFVCPKVSDNEILSDADFSKFKEEKIPFVMFPLDVNVKSSRDVFLENVEKCIEENMMYGIFAYGKATGPSSGEAELKRFIKFVGNSSDNFSKFVMYAINDDFVKENAEDEEAMVNYIRTYNAIADGLTNLGYQVMFSKELEASKKIDVYNDKYGIEKYETSLFLVVRDLEYAPKDVSVIVSDPWKDYDQAEIKSSKYGNNEKLKKQIGDWTNLNIRKNNVVEDQHIKAA